jgi:AcrR family transcriptional regulator
MTPRAAPPAQRRRVPRPGPGPILESALASFYAIGYGGATVRDIASGADVTVASVYHHFESKQDMLVQIMYGAMQDNLVAIRAQKERYDGDPSAQLQHMIGAIVEYHTSHQAEAFVGNSELRSLEEPGRASVIALRDEEESLFRAVLDQGIEQGVFGISNSVLTTRAILAMASGVAAWYRAGGRIGLKELKDEYGAMGLRLAAATA